MIQKKTIELINQYDDPIFKTDPNFKAAITDAMLTAYFMSDRFQDLVDLFDAEADWYEVDHIGNYIHYLKGLVRVGRHEDVRLFMRTYDPGRFEVMDPHYLYKTICDEYLLIDDTVHLAQIIDDFRQFNEKNKAEPTYKNNLGYIAFYQGDYARAIEHWSDDGMELTDFQQVLKNLKLAICQIRLGNTEYGQKVIEQLDAVQSGSPDGFITNAQLTAVRYATGAIYANMGMYDEAVYYFEQSLKNGALRFALTFPQYAYINFENDVLIKDILDEPQFVELIERY